MNSREVLGRALRLSILAMLALAIVGGIVGWFWLGEPGMLSFVIGAALTLLFSGVTILSIMIASKYDVALFFGIVLGSWLLKLVIFIVILALVRDQPFIDNLALFIALVIAIVANLSIDSYVALKSRMPYVNPPAEVKTEPKDENSGE